LYTRLGLLLHHEAKKLLEKLTQKLGAKLLIHTDGVVYVVPSNFHKSSLQFIQYITSHTFKYVILLSEAISEAVVIDVAVQVVSIVYNLCVASVLCLTTNLSLLDTVL